MALGLEAFTLSGSTFSKSDRKSNLDEMNCGSGQCTGILLKKKITMH